jgi:hypothetical protein
VNSQAFQDERIDALAKLLQERADMKHGRADAVGLVELLLHFTAQHAPDGDLSRFSAQSVAHGVDWEGDADMLLTVFEDAGYLKPGRFFEGWERMSEWSDA